MQFKSPQITANVLPENAIAPPHAKQSTKINGGIEIPRLQAKHFVSITADRFELPHQCSGTLLNDRWVLTTASHLPLQIDPENMFLTYELIVGAGRKGVNGTTYLVERAVIHPDFDASTRANNLAMIKSRTPILFNDFAQPVQLSTDYVEDDHPSYVVGYRNVSILSGARIYVHVCRACAFCADIRHWLVYFYLIAVTSSPLWLTIFFLRF